MRILTAALTASALAAAFPPRQDPTAPDLLKATAAYGSTYAEALSGTVLEEQAMVTEISSGRMGAPPKRVASDVTFVSTTAGVVALRDAYAIDTKPTRERTLRVVTALNEGTAEGQQRVQEYVRQTFHLFMANIVLMGADTMLALKVISPEHQAKFTYRTDGRKKINDVAVVALRFQEPTARDKVYALGTPGNAHASGRFWVEPGSGAIHAIDLWLESQTESASVEIQFGPDPARKLLLPRQLSGTYDEREPGSGRASTTTARARRIEVVAKYSNPRYQAIK